MPNEVLSVRFATLKGYTCSRTGIVVSYERPSERRSIVSRTVPAYVPG